MTIVARQIATNPPDDHEWTDRRCTPSGLCVNELQSIDPKASAELSFLIKQLYITEKRGKYGDIPVTSGSDIAGSSETSVIER